MEWALPAMLVIAQLAFWGVCLWVAVLIFRHFRASASARRPTGSRRHLGPRRTLPDSYDSGSFAAPSAYESCSDSMRAGDTSREDSGSGQCEADNSNDAGSDSGSCDSGGDGGSDSGSSD